MNYYLYFIPLISLVYCISAYISNKLNLYHSHKWFLFSILIGNCGIILWTLMAKVSTNIVLDGMLFDVFMSLAFTLTLFYLGVGSSFTFIQWIGCIVVLIGIILMKV